METCVHLYTCSATCDFVVTKVCEALIITCGMNFALTNELWKREAGLFGGFTSLLTGQASLASPNERMLHQCSPSWSKRTTFMKIVHDLDSRRAASWLRRSDRQPESQINDEAANSEAENRGSCYGCICTLHNACKNARNGLWFNMANESFR